MMKTKQPFFLVTSLYYALIFMAGGGFVSYIGLYYASVKIDNSQIGMISSVGLLVGMIAQPMWGTIADRSNNKTTIVKVLLLLSAGLIWLIPLAGNSFWLILIAVSIVQFFGNAIVPMGDSITLELAKKEGFKFSTVRFIGSAGFAVMSAIAGKIFSINITYIFLLFCILRLLSWVVSLKLPPVRGVPKTKEVADSFFDLFKDRKLIIIYLYIFCIATASGFFGAFHAIYSKKVGISLELIGIGIMIGSFTQFPFMIYFDWIYKKIGLVRILLISGIATGVRWFLYSYALSSHTILFIWGLHGFTFILFYLCLADYVDASVPKRLRTRGQIMNSIVLLGASGITGGTIGGFLSNAIGLKHTFLVGSGLCFAAVIGLFIATRLLDDFKAVNVEDLPAVP